MSSCNLKENNSSFNNESLPKISITKDSLLIEIFREVLSEDNECAFMYEVAMNDYHDGTLIVIKQNVTDQIDGSRLWNGYTELDEKIFLIGKIVSRYTLDMASPSQHMVFTIADEKDLNQNERKLVWLFYILKNVFARFVPEVGWIWSDGKPDE